MAAHSSWLRDRLLNIKVAAFDDGAFVNYISEYVATMDFDGGIEYLTAISGEPRSTFEPVMKELRKRKLNGANTKVGGNKKKDNVAQAKAVFWGAEAIDPPADEKSANGYRKKKNSRGKTLFSTSGNNHYRSDGPPANGSHAQAEKKPSLQKTRAPGDYSSYSNGSKHVKKAAIPSRVEDNSKPQKQRGSNYTNCVLCGSIVWYNLPEERICNSQLHPRCNNLKIDSVDPRTGLIDQEHGKKRRSNRNKKKREKDLLDDPTTGKFLEGYTAALEQKDRLVHFDREVAARSRVFDDQNDYFQDSNDRWLSQAERELARRKFEAIREKKTMKRKNVKISFDIAGRRVVSYDDEDKDEDNFGENAMTVLGSSNTAKKAAPIKRNEFDLEKDVLGHNDGTGFCQNVLDGRAGKIYNRLQSSFKAKTNHGNGENIDDAGDVIAYGGKKRALNLPRKKGNVVFNPEEDF